MSIVSMTSAKVARQAARGEEVPCEDGTSPEPAEPSIAPNELTPGRLRESDRGGQGYINQVVRFIPTEVIALYVAFLAALGEGPSPTDPTADFTGRWVTFGVYLLITPAMVALIYRARSRRACQPFRTPYFEMGAAMIAFTAWAMALPDTPFASIPGWNEAIGGFCIGAASLVLPLLADVFGKSLNFEG